MDRQQVIETNRSLRNIKNELESLLEKGILNPSTFDSIQALLPAESSLSAIATPQPAAAPPSYAQSTGSTANSTGAAPPPLPGRKQPPPAPPTKPVIANAVALYKYAAADARDVSFSKGDHIAVYEKMNADWWLGRNETSGEEGIFPRSYVEEQHDEKAGGYGGYPAAPGQANPYNSSVPPMGVAGQYSGNQGGAGYEDDGKPTKTEENTKKFGKKLGNAAIFGAGATLGGKIVNSIF